jgi:hypothetical protein
MMSFRGLSVAKCNGRRIDANCNACQPPKKGENEFLTGGQPMTIRERLLECKVKLGIKSDYKLAKALEMNRGTLSRLMNGKGVPDVFTAVKMAEILKVHPMQLQAEFEAENAKDADRKAFWINFGRRIKTGALAMLALISTAFWSPEPRAESSALIRIMLGYVNGLRLRFDEKPA